MESGTFDVCRNVTNRSGPSTQRPQRQTEAKARKKRGSRCLVLMTVCLGIICVVLLVFIIAQHISNTAERESLNQKKLELESKVSSLSEEVKRKGCKEGYVWGPDGLFISDERKNWSDSRQYCRDRGADLVIINTEEKQKSISSFFKERVWIGLSDIENEGDMKWVDNSPLNQGFWSRGEPNDHFGGEDCVELKSFSSSSDLNNWNDVPCSMTKKAICEK